MNNRATTTTTEIKFGNNWKKRFGTFSRSHAWASAAMAERSEYIECFKHFVEDVLVRNMTDDIVKALKKGGYDDIDQVRMAMQEQVLLCPMWRATDESTQWQCWLNDSFLDLKSEKTNPRAVALVFTLGEAQRGVRFRMNQSQPVGADAVDNNPNLKGLPKKRRG